MLRRELAPSIRNSNEIAWFPIGEIKPYEGHARTHNKRHNEKLKKLHGQVCPVIVDSDGVLVDGHAVLKAMRELGSSEIAAVVVANRTGPEIKALRLALNRIPMDAAWNDDRVRVELEQLVSLSFDLELTGFDAVEIDHLLDVDVPKLNVTEDGEPIPALQSPAVTAAGDICVSICASPSAAPVRRSGSIARRSARSRGAERTPNVSVALIPFYFRLDLRPGL